MTTKTLFNDHIKKKSTKGKEKVAKATREKETFPEVVKKHHPLKKKIMPITPIIQDESTSPLHASTREERVLRSRTVKLTKQGKIPKKK